MNSIKRNHSNNPKKYTFAHTDKHDYISMENTN